MLMNEIIFETSRKTSPRVHYMTEKTNVIKISLLLIWVSFGSNVKSYFIVRKSDNDFKQGNFKIGKNFFF